MEKVEQRIEDKQIPKNEEVEEEKGKQKHKKKNEIFWKQPLLRSAFNIPKLPQTISFLISLQMSSISLTNCYFPFLKLAGLTCRTDKRSDHSAYWPLIQVNT